MHVQLTDISSWFASEQQFEAFMFLVQAAIVQGRVSSLCLLIQIPTGDKNISSHILDLVTQKLFVQYYKKAQHKC